LARPDLTKRHGAGRSAPSGIVPNDGQSANLGRDSNMEPRPYPTLPLQRTAGSAGVPEVLAGLSALLFLILLARTITAGRRDRTSRHAAARDEEHAPLAEESTTEHPVPASAAVGGTVGAHRNGAAAKGANGTAAANGASPPAGKPAPQRTPPPLFRTGTTSPSEAVAPSSQGSPPVFTTPASASAPSKSAEPTSQRPLAEVPPSSESRADEGRIAPPVPDPAKRFTRSSTGADEPSLVPSGGSTQAGQTRKATPQVEQIVPTKHQGGDRTAPASFSGNGSNGSGVHAAASRPRGARASDAGLGKKPATSSSDDAQHAWHERPRVRRIKSLLRPKP